MPISHLGGQDKTDVLYEAKNNQIIWYYFSDVENSLYHHLVSQAQTLLDQRKETVRQLEDKQDWKERQKYIKSTLEEIIGPFPDKTPLRDRVIKTIKKENYRIEHIIFESHPGFHVTSSLFIPEGLKQKAPVILLCSGHAGEAYRSSVYLHEILNYVNKGFIVFAFDPIGQGERIGYYDPETRMSRLKKATHEHSFAGAQVLMSGSSMARYMTWDGIRAIDYLLTRSEIDPDRIGITGRSGGGLQTSLIAALDDRIYAAAPECFITNMEMVLKIIGGQDAEQIISSFIQRGLDHADLLTVRVPKPTLIVSTINDFFSIHGSRKTACEVSNVYNLFGAVDHFGMVKDLDIHASTKKNREAKYAFFQKHLKNPGSSKDLDTEELTEEELQITPTGQVITTYQGETVYSLNKKMVQQMHEQLQAERRDHLKFRKKVLKQAKKISGYHEVEECVEAVYAGRHEEMSYVLDKYYIEGEGDYPVPFWLFKPEKPVHKIIIYLHPEGKREALEEDTTLITLISKGYTILAPDLLGTGETGPGVYKGDSYINGVSYNLLFDAVLIDRSITGIRAGDINRLVSWANKYLEIEEIYCVAEEHSAPEALHAALFNPRINRLALLRPFSSYRAIAMTEYYSSDYVHSIVPGALTAYDLPDIAAMFAPRKLMIVNPLDGQGLTANADMINEDMKIVRKGYAGQDIVENLTIIQGNNSIPTVQLLLNWAE